MPSRRRRPRFVTFGSVEDRLNRCGVLPRPNELGRGAPADQQANGADENGLPSSSLAGEYVEPGFEVQLEAIDDCQVADGKEAQHERPSAILSDV